MSRLREQGTILNTALRITAITSLIDAKSAGVPYISQGMLIPKQWQTGPEKKTINFYSNSPDQGGLEYGDITWSVVCRAPQEKDAENIADAVFDNLNRQYKGTHSFICMIQPAVPPLDGSDNYNRTVEITVRNH